LNTAHFGIEVIDENCTVPVALGARAIARGTAKLKGNKIKLMNLRVVRATASQEAVEQQMQEVTAL